MSILKEEKAIIGALEKLGDLTDAKEVLAA